MQKKINKKMLLAAWSINNPHWIINQAYNIPLRKIFREVINFDPQEEINNHGKKEMNKKFIELLKKEKPDYIHLFLVWDEFYPETLVKIKEILPKVKVTHWNGDDDIKFENYTVPYSAGIDYQFISQLQFTKKYDEYGLSWYDMLGADTDKFRPLGIEKKYDVVFVGTPKGDRLKYMRSLLNTNVNFIIGGAGWADYPEFKGRYIGKIADEDFVKLINETKITLCFSQNFFSSPHVLERSLAVNACKSFALTEYVDGYFPKFTEGKDIVTFKNEKEMYEKIQYYLKNEKEREKIAETAYKKITEKFSNQKMMREAYKHIEKDKKTLHGLEALKYAKIKPVYLDKLDFRVGKSHIAEKVKSAKYVCFKNKKHETVPYRDLFQVYSMELVKKPISICDSLLSSRLIGDYATLSLYYAYNYLDKKEKYFYENTDISQFMVEKEFFLKNLDKFDEFYKNGKASFINKDNTQFISMPLIRTRKIKKIPVKNVDHILFTHLDSELIALKNQKRLFRNIFIYKVMLYIFFFNQQMLKHILLNVIKRTKKPILVKISKFCDKIF